MITIAANIPSVESMKAISIETGQEKKRASVTLYPLWINEVMHI